MKLTFSAPKREVHGLTFTQNVGVFPRQVSLEIRHTHPALGLNEVAHQRQRHSQVQDNHFTQQQQCHYQNLQPQHNVRFHEYFTMFSCLFCLILLIKTCENDLVSLTSFHQVSNIFVKYRFEMDIVLKNISSK